jgi:PAS domain S-box-containing protein
MKKASTDRSPLEGLDALRARVAEMEQQQAKLVREAEQLRCSEERFRHLSEAAFEAIVVHDHGRILDGNEAFAKISGWPLGELMGTSVFDLIVPEYRDFARQKIESECEQPYVLWVTRSDGVRFPVEVRARMVQYHGQRVRVSALRNLTELHAAQEALRASQERYYWFSTVSGAQLLCSKDL